ncbi:hypothetical protein NLG97_g286 [Lecanicillium saksenae]|uniref:Uncharacterized protein n=1 Tax=Lecanicillium saksenae TaxID=468837 RepID=A0ACC1R730_9HYPO|nr:hypothetical protein NLG97_g286 [Lecanicillium saksenae]
MPGRRDDDCALALADAEKYDVVLLQEPWTARRDTRCLTKTHPAYDTFSPIDSWENNDTRPRVMTYVRRDERLRADQQRPVSTRDIIWITINDTVIVNFYRQPDTNIALDTLLSWQAPRKCLVAGDFNARHHSWQTGNSSQRGKDIAAWAELNKLDLLNTIDIPTNPHGNTIDLAFSNIPLADVTVEDHLATSSDHYTLSITLPEISPAPLQPKKTRVTSDSEIKRFSELVELGIALIPHTATTPTELDNLANALISLLKSSAQAAGRVSRKGTKSAPWWTEDCAEAAIEYRATIRRYPAGFSYEIQCARRNFQRVIKRAKRQYWRTLIDSFTDNASVFKAVRWLRSPGQFQPPPLQVGDDVYESQMDKAGALRRATLERRTASDDIADPWTPVTPPRIIPFSKTVTIDEARECTIRTGNTSPGSDSITVKMLQTVWYAIGPHVRRLYEGCLSAGYHPTPFREAEVVMIPKPGRRDLSKTKSWRPISLLSCLGKRLERLIARRLAWAAIHYGVLHTQQAGALPKRSAVDLVAALVHDIEETFAQGLVATLVTMDVEGAFDTVMRNRLILRLRQQGWPEHLARWAGSFMQDRAARVRYQDVTTPTSPLQCGLPQGSPASPILFLLYTEPIYRLRNQAGRFGYADDTAILCIGASVEETAANASACVAEMISWGDVNGISFDPNKTEVMHFSRHRLANSPPVWHGDMEKYPEAAMRWLGILLDSSLTFKPHIGKWAAKAQAVANHLRHLTNTRHGPSPSAVRAAVMACVEPVLMYGTEVWYPGKTRPRWSKPTKTIPTRIQHLLQIMSKTLNHSMRAILPVWKTTPTTILHRETGIPPVRQLLEARQLRFAARLKSLDKAHPLAQRTRQLPPRIINPLIKRRFQPDQRQFPTRLRRTDQLLLRCERPLLLAPRSEHSRCPLQTSSKEETAAEFQLWLSSAPSSTLIVYSDGSLSEKGVAGYGYTVHRLNCTTRSGSGRLGPAEVFDAEAVGALEGLKAALEIPDASTHEIFVCLDNLAAATCLRGTASDSSQAAFLEFQALASAHGATQVRWIPGHTKIPGNEEADALAKAGCSLPAPLNAPPTLAFLRKVARQQPRDAFASWWQDTAPARYRLLNLQALNKCPPEFRLARVPLHHLLAARSHHGDFADYHERFNHEDARITCSCGRRKSHRHIFFCRKVPAEQRIRLTSDPNATISRILGRDFQKFTELAAKTSFFSKICRRH